VTEGIFRISGSSNEVGKLKGVLNKVDLMQKQQQQNKLIDLKEYSPHSVAGILKMYFRELPQPILGFEAYNKLTAVNAIEHDKGISVSRSLLNNLPAANQAVFKYLVAFLVYVSQHSAVNKMTTANIAIVWVPNLVWPQEETLETILTIPKLNGGVQFIVENYAEIFGNPL